MKKRRVLVADDSITIQKLVNLTLAGEGFEIITASDGLDAVMKIKRLKPDVILLDADLRELDAAMLLDDIRQDSELLASKLIVLFEAEGSRLQDDRIDAYLSKPFNSKDLELLVEQVVNEEQSTVIRMTDPAVENSDESQRDDHSEDSVTDVPGESLVRGPFRNHTESSMSDRLSAIAKEVERESHQEILSSPTEIQKRPDELQEQQELKSESKEDTLTDTKVAEPSPPVAQAQLSFEDLEKIAREEIQKWIQTELSPIAEKLVKEAFFEKSKNQSL